MAMHLLRAYLLRAIPAFSLRITLYYANLAYLYFALLYNVLHCARNHYRIVLDTVYFILVSVYCTLLNM